MLGDYNEELLPSKVQGGKFSYALVGLFAKMT